MGRIVGQIEQRRLRSESDSAHSMKHDGHVFEGWQVHAKACNTDDRCWSTNTTRARLRRHLDKRSTVCHHLHD